MGVVNTIYQSISSHMILGNSILHIASFFLLILISFLLGRVLYWFFQSKSKQWQENEEFSLNKTIWNILYKPVVVVLVLGMVYFSFGVLKIPVQVQLWVTKLFTITTSLLITFALANVYEKGVLYSLEQFAKKSDTDVDKHILPIVISGGRIVIITLGVMIGMSNAGYNIMSLVAGLGVGGIALAMAARESISHMFGGISIYADKPFRVGDFIVVDEEKDLWGEVIKIGMRSTRVKTNEDTMLVIPNSIIGNQTIINISAFKPRRRHGADIILSHTNPPEKVQLALESIQQVLQEKQFVEKAKVHLYKIKPNGFEIRVRYFVNPFQEYHDTVNANNMKILQVLQEKQIKLAVPLLAYQKIDSNEVN
ncbi:MAG: mechanosensitive ion channel family protein [Spirochaetota bacterium]